MNSLVGRIFWDFLREKYWTDQVAHKIQKKLSKIKVMDKFNSKFNLFFKVSRKLKSLADKTIVTKHVHVRLHFHNIINRIISVMMTND